MPSGNLGNLSNCRGSLCASRALHIQAPPHSSHPESEGDRAGMGPRDPEDGEEGIGKDREGQGGRERPIKTEKDGGPRRKFIPSRGAD